MLVLLQAGVIYLPIAQQLIGTTSLSLTEQLPILLNILLLFVIVEIEKRISKMIAKKRNAELPT